MLNVDQFVADCRAALTQSTPELAVKEILERTVASSSEVEAALGTPREGKIGILHHDRDLTILNVVWTPGMAVYPHDHRMWAVIGIYGGREENFFFRRADKGLTRHGMKELNARDVAPLGKSIIHAVTNPLDRITAAIHVYGGDFFATPRSEWNPETLEEIPYDVEATMRAFEEANERLKTQAP